MKNQNFSLEEKHQENATTMWREVAVFSTLIW